MEITFEKMKTKHYNGAVKCVLNTFLRGEPMLNALGVKKDEFIHFVEIYVKKAISDGYSVVALENDRVIGSIVSEDLLTEPPKGIEKCFEFMMPVFDVLSKLDEKYIEAKKPQKGEVYHMLLGSVYKEYAGNKVTVNMIKRADELAVEAGFKKNVVEATGNISAAIFAKDPNFKEFARINYLDFEFEGKKIFKNIKGGEACILFEKELF